MASPVPSPIVVSTSQVWDKDTGGTWSTFILNIGTPPQPSRVIISTSSGETWVVGPEGCPQKYGSNCEGNRGLLFRPNSSTTWTANNNFSLFLKEDLDYQGNGQFGFDTVSLGYTGSGGRWLEQQTVAAIASPDYWLGIFGLDPAPSNFTNMNEPRPSFLENLATRNMIPSLSWGFTAGANYRTRKPQGSLTLGGYDSNRFIAPNLTFKMYDDVSRRFMVDLKSVSYTQSFHEGSQGSFLAKANCKRQPQVVTADSLTPTINQTTLMTQPISIAIDSTVPHLYLPQDICERFEKAFGIVWLSNNNTYILNATAHSSINNPNLNITFTLADPQGKTLNITFPYSAFNATIQGNTTSPTPLSFPLKRAMNDTQYTLGRTFLQEAYMIADYQRSTFTIAPCTWPSTLTQDIKSILPPSAANSDLSIPELAPKSPKRRLLIPAIIIPVLSILSILLLFRYIRYRKKQHESTVPPSTPPVTETTKLDEFRKPELDTAYNEIKEIDGAEFRAEIEGKELQYELDSAEIHEMPHGERVN